MLSPTVRAYTFVALRLPSGAHKVLKLIPDTIVSLGKYGSFHCNLLLGRPFYSTFELFDTDGDGASSKLRSVLALELHADNSLDDDDAPIAEDVEDSFEVNTANGEVSVRNNMLTIDDPSRQTMTMAEIESLKKEASSSGKDIISKIMQSHSALDEKTAFSLAKYTLRKTKKYMRRFTVLPLDVSMLTQWMLHEKEPSRIMEMREENLGLIASWSNVHCTRGTPVPGDASGRWLVIDDTGGLIVAALAERMDILHPQETEDHESTETQGNLANGVPNDTSPPSRKEATNVDNEPNTGQTIPGVSTNATSQSTRRPRKPRRNPPDAMSARSNTLTLIHTASQPNISMLAYFGYNPNDTLALEPCAASQHPLHTHLKTVSWLQLLDPEQDGTYQEPELADDASLATWKASKRSNYFRKRRRWECTKRVVDETRAGGFDGLVVASFMDIVSIVHKVVPLLKGGAPVVAYSPNVEPLAELMDVYSTPRKSAFLNLQRDGSSTESLVPSEDFPLDPRLLLAPSLQTARAREWQVLPGRTHPVMTSRGGPDGYLFTATRVLPVEGTVEARGKFTKKRKVVEEMDSNGPA